MAIENAWFYAFKSSRSGKWKYSGRGHVSLALYNEVFNVPERRKKILEENGGRFPGMSNAAVDLIWVVIPDHEVEHGFPLLLQPEE